jgi:hypothetical protein
MAITTGLHIRLNFHARVLLSFKFSLSPGNAQNGCETAQVHLTYRDARQYGVPEAAGHIIGRQWASRL